MDILLRKRVRRDIEFGMIYGAIVLLGLAALRLFPSVTELLPFCLFRGMTGLPCPTCGSTRAALHLVSGDVIASLSMNPAISVLLIGSSAYFFYSAFSSITGARRITIVLSEPEQDALRAGVIMLFVLNWGYLLFTLPR